MSKIIGEMTLADAQAENEKSAAQAVEQGYFTDKGAQFSNEVSAVINKYLAEAGLQAVDASLMLPGLADLSIRFQGLLDSRGPVKRESDAAKMFQMHAITFMLQQMDKQRGKGGSTKASFSDFDGSSPPDLYN